VLVLRFLVAWANVPFTIAAGIALVFAMLQATGILGLLAGGDHEADADADADVDADTDVDADVDADADADADGDHDADHDADGDADGHGFSFYVLGPLGFGKVPFSVIWQTYAVVFAATGLALNARMFLNREGGPPTGSLLWTLPIALVAGYGVVAMLARWLGPVFASTKEQATSRAQLVGQTGIVISSKVTSEFGEVRIRDKSGHDLRVVCKLADGSSSPKEHQRVVVVEYEGGDLRVAPIDDEPDAEPDKAHVGK
jgi:membrane protein implicated in regulation of membrane protease activity